SSVQRATFGGFEERRHLCTCEERREGATNLGDADGARRVRIHQLFQVEEAKQGSGGGQLPRDGTLGEPSPARTIAHEGTDREAVHVAPRPIETAEVGGEENLHLVEVAGVCRDGSSRELALVADVRQEQEQLRR